jgi:acetylglutamate kinase
MGVPPTFVGGRRVTAKNDLSLLRMILSGTVNKRLVSALIAEGAPAVGLSGEDGRLIGAEPIDRSTLGYAGQPRVINAHLLQTMMAAGYLPVISPVGSDMADEGAGALNVNGDDAAAAIALALEADELLLIADVRGVYDDSGALVDNLSVDVAREMIQAGTAKEGMAAKLESASDAVLAGVSRVRICDLSGLTSPECGTLITQPQGVAS